MPWCPKCKTEYREGVNKCSDCNENLVDNSTVKNKEFTELDHEALLVTASNKQEADIIESKMRSCGIPVMKKHKSIGAYLEIFMGTSNLGINIYVPSKLLEDAKQIIKTEDITVDPADLEFERSYNKKRRILMWIFLLMMFSSVIFYVAYTIIKFIFDKMK